MRQSDGALNLAFNKPILSNFEPNVRHALVSHKAELDYTAARQAAETIDYSDISNN